MSEIKRMRLHLQQMLSESASISLLSQEDSS